MRRSKPVRIRERPIKYSATRSASRSTSRTRAGGIVPVLKLCRATDRYRYQSGFGKFPCWQSWGESRTSYRPRLKPKLDPEGLPPPAPAQKPRRAHVAARPGPIARASVLAVGESCEEPPETTRPPDRPTRPPRCVHRPELRSNSGPRPLRGDRGAASRDPSSDLHRPPTRATLGGMGLHLPTHSRHLVLR